MQGKSVVDTVDQMVNKETYKIKAGQVKMYKSPLLNIHSGQAPFLSVSRLFLWQILNLRVKDIVYDDLTSDDRVGKMKHKQEKLKIEWTQLILISQLLWRDITKAQEKRLLCIDVVRLHWSGGIRLKKQAMTPYVPALCLSYARSEAQASWQVQRRQFVRGRDCGLLPQTY